MQGCAERIKKLDPRDLIAVLSRLVSKHGGSEVFVRRVISAVYFALFNYWSAKVYCRGMRRGRGPRQDSFPYSLFHEELVENGLDRDIYALYVYRVAADHYTLNPTKVRLYDKIWKGKIEDVLLDEEAVRRILEAATNILVYLSGI